MKKLPESYKKALFSKIKILLVIGITYYLVTWFTGCPIKYFTGISCPGCGMTRAWIAALHLDFAGAFAFHPLFFTVPLIILGFLLDDWIDLKKYRWLVILLGILFLVVYLVRIIWFPDDVVSFHPENGLFWKVTSNILQLLTN